ncbi:hypothetical protein FOMG_19593 [Fusarium oxysporum f. sp. melonis 26406]|uniref:Uncharacterized protein n=1 Tax=Fusarium oxysporum f. sp. melonis 26406 TaxID=1089452 RepID=W9ZRA6_FUSOX|nr:hypothetical protein FOMG_19593 [Fusarium oxysporum f. sp. melonis 26406]
MNLWSGWIIFTSFKVIQPRTTKANNRGAELIGF